MAASEKALVVGFHFPFPAMGTCGEVWAGLPSRAHCVEPDHLRSPSANLCVRFRALQNQIDASRSPPRSRMDPERSSTRSAFAYREVMEYLAGARTAYSGLMLAARITLPHFSVSSTINTPKPAG